jgi:cyclopropane fatty-acyl-phospholipid synthase-like methyltransferase
MCESEDIGLHYVQTLNAWRERFHGALPQIRRLGFDARFIRMWDYYLAYCAAAFAERYISDVQLIFAKDRTTAVNSQDVQHGRALPAHKVRKRSQ